MTEIPGISELKATSITKLYPSLFSLVNKYSSCSSIEEKESLLSDITIGSITQGSNKSKIGNAISKKIFKILSSNDPNSLFD